MTTNTITIHTNTTHTKPMNSNSHPNSPNGSNDNDKVGTWMGMPYDFRKPTMQRLKERWWNKDGPMFTPKLWGIGWDLNFRHPGSWVLLGGVGIVVVMLVKWG